MRFDRGLAALFASTLTALAGCSSTCKLTVSGDAPDSVQSLYFVVGPSAKLAKDSAESARMAMQNADVTTFDGWAQFATSKGDDSTILFHAPIGPWRGKGCSFEPAEGTADEAVLEFKKDMAADDIVLVLVDRGEAGKKSNSGQRWQLATLSLKEVCDGQFSKVVIREHDLVPK